MPKHNRNYNKKTFEASYLYKDNVLTGRKYLSKFNLKVHTVTEQLSALATYFKTKSFSMGAFLDWVLNSVKVKTAKSVQRKFFRKNYLRKVSSKIDHKNRCYIY